MSAPSISVVTATWNSGSTLLTCIQSVNAQRYSQVEHIFVDGASSDGSLALIQSFSTQPHKWISESDRGIYDALNKGIQLATSDVVGFLHADDVYENSEVLSKIAAAFQDPSVDAVYGDIVYVRHDNISKVIRYWKSGPYDNTALSRGWMPPHPTFYVRRSVYERLGMFDTRYRIAADYDTVLRFLAIGKIRAAYIPEVLIRMREGGISNRSLKTIILKSREDILVLRHNKVGGFLTLLWKNFRKVSQFWQRG